MMNNKNIHALWTIVGIFMALVLGFCVWIYPVCSADTSKTDYSGTEIMPVEEVLGNPGNFSGIIGVTGKVMSIEQSRSMFFLGCKSQGVVSCACAEMPVKYEGQMPEIGSDVVVFGEIETTDAGKYVFVGQEVKSQ